MKLIYDGVKDHKQIDKLIRALLANRKGEIISGMSARRLCNDEYGIDIDHHEYAYCLDRMSRTGECKHYNHNYGDSQYLIL